MFNFINKNLLNLIGFACFAALAMAYMAQYIFDFQPCILCLYQRIPFFAIIVISFFAFFIKNKKLQRNALYLVLSLIVVNSSIAFYQVGVEQKIFQGPDKCSATSLEDINDIEELRKAIINTKAVRCDEPTFFFLSLSMAAWNFIYCLALFVVGVFFARKS